LKFWFVCKELAPESDQQQQATQDTTEVSADSGTLQEGKNIDKGKDKEEKDKEKTKDLDKEKGKEKDADKKGEIEKEKLKGLEGTNLDALVQRLPGCVSRDLIDQLTVIISLFLYAFWVYYQFSYFGIKTFTMNILLLYILTFR
jgi:hypothetical protein